MNKPIAVNRATNSESASYGWVITEDAICDGDDKDVFGPSNISDDIRGRLLLKGEGIQFRMYDDDNTFCYAGRMVCEEGEEGGEEAMFGPLDDFGTPNAGAVTIRYRRDEDGKAGPFETL